MRAQESCSGSVALNDTDLFFSSFPDQDIRKTAVQQIENLSNDELLEYLPQLVQVRKKLIAKEVLSKSITSLNTFDYFSLIDTL